MPSNRAVACGLFLVLAPLAGAYTRPLPENADVRIYAEQQGSVLRLLIRVPLAVARNSETLPGIVQTWVAPAIDVFEDGHPVKPGIQGTRISEPSDQSFRSYQDAWAHLRAQAPAETPIADDSAWLDVALEYPLQAGQSAISFQPKFAQLAVRVSTNMTWRAPDGSARNFVFEGDPGVIYVDARVRDAAGQFLVSGLRFVIRSPDFLLFLFCLVLPLRQYSAIFSPAAAFAGGLCLAFVAYAAGFAPDSNWFSPLIETLSALAILLVALANIMGGVTPRRRALFALPAGLVFGYPGATDLAGKIQFAGVHTILARTTYTLGVALAAALVVALLTPALGLIFRFAGTRRVELIIVSALAADTAWGWLAARWDRLSQFPFHAPAFGGILLAATLRWLMFAVLLGGLLWFVDAWLKPGDKRQ